MRSNAARAYSLLFFFSGATGLVYELLWVRILYQAFGSTIQSITTVVAAYMGGLGLGAWLLGRKADRHARPAALYGWLEIAIGAFGLASPFVLSLAHRVYIGTAGTDRKSTRLNSSHSQISYAVFCLKKKKQKNNSYRCSLCAYSRRTSSSTVYHI